VTIWTAKGSSKPWALLAKRPVGGAWKWDHGRTCPIFLANRMSCAMSKVRADPYLADDLTSSKTADASIFGSIPLSKQDASCGWATARVHLAFPYCLPCQSYSCCCSRSYSNRKPQQSWLEFGLDLSRGFSRSNDLDC